MSNSDRSKSWIQTATGKKFDVIDPRAEDVDIFDIAHALSNLCRYTGHCREFYSVAEHCVRVSFRCEELALEAFDKSGFLPPAGMHPVSVTQAARWGLMHDSGEAFINDLNRPLKHQPQLSEYRKIEKRIMGKIAERFSLGAEPPEVAVADDELLWTEVRDIMQPIHPDWKAQTTNIIREPLAHVRIACWAPRKARSVFLKRFAELFPEEMKSEIEEDED